jgi:tetratricopeptide (TPR) repeat protein
VALAGLGHYERAIADFTKAIKVDATNAWAYDGRAWAYLNSKDAGRALLDAERALALSPNDPNFLNTLAHVQEVLGRKRQAIASFQQALAADPSLQSSIDGLKRLGELR